MTKYEIRGDTFHGRIECPISVGSKGGAIKSNPSYLNTLMLLGDPNAETLAQVIVSVGLA